MESKFFFNLPLFLIFSSNFFECESSKLLPQAKEVKMKNKTDLETILHWIAFNVLEVSRGLLIDHITKIMQF
jgi:hypothetical protein